MKVGITGGIGSGKSLACKVLLTMGIPVFVADEEVKKIYDEDTEVKHQLINAFGSNIYKNNLLDRKALAAIAFNNPEMLAKLNAIAHPAVANRFNSWIERQHAPYVVEEAALMFESKANLRMDCIISVSAPENIRIQRVMQRNHCSEEEVRRRMRYQMNEKERNGLSDFVIVNDNESPLLPQLLEVHSILLSCSATS